MIKMNKMKTLKRAIIVGSGASIRQHLWDTPITNLPIWQAIKNEFTIGLNFNYKFFPFTIVMFGDYWFYQMHKAQLDNLPLVLGMYNRHLSRNGKNNTTQINNNIYLLPLNQTETINNKRIVYWGKDSWTKGFYSGHLVGLIALTFAIAIGCKEIFLLGFDACETDGRTHFYQGDKDKTGYYQRNGIEQTGVGTYFNKAGKKLYKTGMYNTDINQYYKVYESDLNRINIFNVSPESKINIFPKITYKEFYDILKNNPEPILQTNAREFIERLLLTKL